MSGVASFKAFIRHKSIVSVLGEVDELNIYQIVEEWQISPHAAFKSRSLVIVIMCFYAFFSVFCASLACYYVIIGDTELSVITAALTCLCTYGIGDALWRYYAAVERRAIKSAAKERLSSDPEAHQEYMLCVERIHAVNAAYAEAAVAQAASADAAASRAQMEAVTKAAVVAQKQAAEMLSPSERRSLEYRIASAARHAAYCRDNHLDSGRAEGEVASLQAKLAGGRK